MKLEDQVCTEDQGERLKKLGIVQESLFYHTHSDKWGVMPKNSIDFSGDPTSAFTVAELGIMLPLGCSTKTRDFGYDDWLCYDQDGDNVCDKYRTEAEARGALLIHLLESELITAAEVNARL